MLCTALCCHIKVLEHFGEKKSKMEAIPCNDIVVRYGSCFARTSPRIIAGIGCYSSGQRRRRMIHCNRLQESCDGMCWGLLKRLLKEIVGGQSADGLKTVHLEQEEQFASVCVCVAWQVTSVDDAR